MAECNSIVIIDAFDSIFNTIKCRSVEVARKSAVGTHIISSTIRFFIVGENNYQLLFTTYPSKEIVTVAVCKGDCSILYIGTLTKNFLFTILQPYNVYANYIFYVRNMSLNNVRKIMCHSFRCYDD